MHLFNLKNKATYQWGCVLPQQQAELEPQALQNEMCLLLQGAKAQHGSSPMHLPAFRLVFFLCLVQIKKKKNQKINHAFFYELLNGVKAFYFT